MVNDFYKSIGEAFLLTNIITDGLKPRGFGVVFANASHQGGYPDNTGAIFKNRIHSFVGQVSWLACLEFQPLNMPVWVNDKGTVAQGANP